MNTYETDGKKYEVLCECNTGFMKAEYEYAYGYEVSYIKNGIYVDQCQECRMCFYYDPNKPLYNPIEFITKEEFSV